MWGKMRLAIPIGGTLTFTLFMLFNADVNGAWSNLTPQRFLSVVGCQIAKYFFGCRQPTKYFPIWQLTTENLASHTHA
jgi:hypothetical protein